jgi:hypothetical protein
MRELFLGVVAVLAQELAFQIVRRVRRRYRQ